MLRDRRDLLERESQKLLENETLIEAQWKDLLAG